MNKFYQSQNRVGGSRFGKSQLSKEQVVQKSFVSRISSKMNFDHEGLMDSNNKLEQKIF